MVLFGYFSRALLAGYHPSVGRHLLLPKLPGKPALVALRRKQIGIWSRSISQSSIRRMSGIIDLTGEDDISPKNQYQPLGTDSEDEDLKQAIALSLQDQEPPASSPSLPVNGEATTKSETAPQVANVTSTSNLLGLDRKAMEAERLARLKRKREADGHDDDNPRSTAPAAAALSRAKAVSPPPLRNNDRQLAARKVTARSLPSSQPRPSSPSPSSHSFSKPHIFLTSDPPRRTPSATLTSVSLPALLTPPSPNKRLKSALLSSFITDFDWLLPHFDTRSTSFVFLLHAQSPEHRKLLEGDFQGVPNVRLLMPEVLGGGSGGFSGNMHSKVMTLIFESEKGSGEDGICRIVISSANLIPADWGVGGVMENTVFVVDLPLLNESVNEDTTTNFGRGFKQQLGEMGVPGDVLRRLDEFDWTPTKHVGFVHSMSKSLGLRVEAANDVNEENSISALMKKRSARAAAKSQVSPAAVSTAQTGNSGEQERQGDPARTGLLSLSDTITSLGLGISKTDDSYPPKLDFITSSLGNLSLPFLRQLWHAVCGNLDPLTSASGTARKGRTSKDVASRKDDDTILDEMIKENLCIYFPTAETVRHSKGGPDSAGTICFQKKWWETNELIRKCLHDCTGVRGDGVLMHSKILYVRYNHPKIITDGAGGAQVCTGWAYIGSANLSESAWGRITSDAKTKLPKLTCRNWESGIIIPVSLEGEAKAQTLGSVGHQSAKGIPQRRRKGAHEKGKAQNTTDEGTEVLSESIEESSATSCAAMAPDSAETFKPLSADLTSFPNKLSPAAVQGHGPAAECTGARLTEDPVEESLDKVFSGRVPVPFVCPASRHVDTKKDPWFFRE